MKIELPPAAFGTKPAIIDEAERLAVLSGYTVDTLEDDPELRSIAAFAARLCNLPIAQVTLVEETRQRFLAGKGLDVKETPREDSFCQHAMLEGDVMEVRDALADPRFAENPLVTGAPHLRFYAGQPLISDQGVPLGALCVIDTSPRAEGLTELQKQGLAVLGQTVMRRLCAHREGIAAQTHIAEREELLRRLLDSVPQVAWSADADGRFDYFNRRWEETTGAAPPRVAEDWRPFVHLDDAESAFGNWYAAVAKAEPFEAEYRLLHADGSWRWVLSLAVPVTESNGNPPRWFGTITDIDEVHRLSESRDLLSRELSHRIKNIFAVVNGLISLRVRRQPEHQSFADELIDTLQALGRAHDFVRPAGGSTRDSLKGLLEELFRPYCAEGETRIEVRGDHAAIAPDKVTPLALIFHELATNSAKYGALSRDKGMVSVLVADLGETLVLRWEEKGTNSASVEAGSGFGTRLIDMSVRSQLQGSWERRFDGDLLVVELKLAKAAIAP